MENSVGDQQIMLSTFSYEQETTAVAFAYTCPFSNHSFPCLVIYTDPGIEVAKKCGFVRDVAEITESISS